jgi:hypothetical protein
MPASRRWDARCSPGFSFLGSVEDFAQCADSALHVLVTVCANSVSSLSVVIFVIFLSYVFLMRVFFSYFSVLDIAISL